MSTLWGIDHGLEGAERFFTCLPVMKDGETFTRALSFQWGDGRGVAPIADDADLRDSCEPLELAEEVEVPEGSVVLVMGPRFAHHLASLDVTLETDWHAVQDEFRVAVLSWDAAEQRRRAYAQRARAVLTSDLAEAFRKEHAMLAAGRADAITPRTRAAQAIVLNTAFLEPFEVAVLDLLVSKLLGDGGTAYSRLLLLHATSLRLDVELIRKSVEARLSHLAQPPDPAKPKVRRTLPSLALPSDATRPWAA
jgi:hypothetical protein